MHTKLTVDVLEDSSAIPSTPTLPLYIQLGEGAEWGKHTNWERAIHVPLIIRAPWKKASVGQHTQSFVELVDLYRTMISLAGLPQEDIEKDVAGDDLSAMLDDPGRTLKQLAFSQYSRCPGDRYVHPSPNLHLHLEQSRAQGMLS